MIKGNIEGKSYYQYALDVVEGKQKAGEYIKLACQRFLDDLKREDLYFDVEAVDKAISFIAIMKHSTDSFADLPFILLPWQAWCTANIFGFYWANDGSRRFATAYIEISRKNGKSSISAAYALYSLIVDNGKGGQIICAANSKEQAKILLNCATGYAKSLDPKGKMLKIFRSEIKFPAIDSFIKIVAADTSKLDGLNCSTFIIDEYHEARDTKMWDVLKSSQGMRKNGLGIIITTAGFDKSKPCYQKRSVGVEILHKVKEDDTFFAAIYSLDDGDDWTEEENWLKASPCLGETVTYKYMREQIKAAKNNPSEEVGVKTKNLNVWCDSAEVWLPEHYITRCTQKVNIEDFRDCPCYVGVDLAATSDLTAVAYLFEKEGKLYSKVDYYVPETALIEKPDKELYKLWKQMGLIKVTPGNVTDYDYIINDLVAASEIVNLQVIGYDKYNATQWAIKSTELGLPLEEYPQNLGNFNRPTRELERLILSNQFIIDNNEVTRFCFRNVLLKYDHNGNVKPNKGERTKKIDGVIAMIQSLGCWLNVPHYSNEIFGV